VLLQSPHKFDHEKKEGKGLSFLSLREEEKGKRERMELTLLTNLQTTTEKKKKGPYKNN